MDVLLLSKNAIKIRSKKASLIIDPDKTMPKTPADCVILMDKESDVSKVSDQRLLVSGPGEYEVGGLKITGISFGGKTAYDLSDENVSDLFLARASAVENVSEKVRDYSVAVINADAALNPTLITALEPRLLILYGEKAREGAKLLGKDEFTVSNKFSFTEDKLMEEMQVVVLE